MAIREISAKFSSRCSVCGSTIRPGQTILYDPEVKNSSRHKTCPAVKQDAKPKVAPDAILNSPVIAQPQEGRLSDEEAAKILADIGSEFVRPLPASEPTLGIGFKVTINGKEIEIGRCGRWVGLATDWDMNTDHVVSLIDGTVLESADWRKTQGIDYWTRQLGAPLSMEAKGKHSVRIGEIQKWESVWYIVTATDRPYYLSAEDADDMDLFTRGGGWATQYQIREITEPKAEREKRGALERAEREQAEQIISQVGQLRDQLIALLPMGIRPLTSDEYDMLWASIHKWEKLRDGRSVDPVELIANKPADWQKELPASVRQAVTVVLGNNWNRLPAMAGNECGAYGWSRIYRWRDRHVVYFHDDYGGPSIQGIEIKPEDAGLLADFARRKQILGYRYDARLYELLTDLDKDGKLSEYGKQYWFGGTPRCLTEDGPCTQRTYSRERSRTAEELREQIGANVARFAAGDPRGDEVLAILRDNAEAIVEF